MTTPDAGPAQLGRDAARAAERLLRRRFGPRARIVSSEPLAGRSSVFRCDVEGQGAPPSLILKLPRPRAEEKYDRRDVAPRSPYWSLTNECAGLELLDAAQRRSPGPAVAPAFYGADLDRGLVLLEDLGDGPSLADLLLGDDAIKAEEGLVAFASSLGRLHALTAGAGPEYAALLELKGRGSDRPYYNGRVRSEIEKLPQTFDEFEFEWSPGLVDDVQQIAASMLEPGPFEAYIHGDPCPDNDRLVDGRMVFFDFETGAFHNAMLDGSYGRVPFPSCWCVNRLPDHLVTKFETAYRLAAMKGIKALGDDTTFEAGIVEAAGWWLIANANQLLPRALRLEQTWGISTYRQRLLYRFGAFVETSSRFGRLEALGAWAYEMRELMRRKWPEVRDMPLYPAFREPA